MLKRKVRPKIDPVPTPVESSALELAEHIERRAALAQEAAVEAELVASAIAEAAADEEACASPNAKRLDSAGYLAEEIQRRAWERYLLRGCEDGHDLEDWLEAERELTELWKQAPPDRS